MGLSVEFEREKQILCDILFMTCLKFVCFFRRRYDSFCMHFQQTCDGARKHRPQAHKKLVKLVSRHLCRQGVKTDLIQVATTFI